MKRLPDFISELFRRRVIRLLTGYIVILSLLALGIASLFPVLGFPDWILRAFIIGGLALVPVLALLSWKFDLVPPHLVPDDSDSASHPGIDRARRRHNKADAGFLLLMWHSGKSEQSRKRYSTAVIIGRGLENDVDLADERVSRNHAVLWAEEGGWWVQDLDSSNGTFLNDTQVSGTEKLPATSELRFHPNGPIIFAHVDMPAPTKNA